MTVLLLALLPTLILPWVIRLIWPHEITWKEMACTLVIGASVTGAIYAYGLYDEMSDTEIWNGQVVGKQRVHDSYTRTYECNCSTNSKGERSCSTCTEQHYTVEWLCNTSIGNIRIDYEDSTTPFVYKKANPPFYTNIQLGDPVAQPHSFINYVKAVPDSLFHANKVDRFVSLIPEYPLGIYNFYSLNRALAVGVPVPDLAAWNTDISMMLRHLGPAKQANVIVVFVNTNDQSYIYALEGKWIGGKKNDIIVVLGVTEYPKIDFVAVSSWTDSQLFKIQLRDAITNIGVVDRPQIITAINDTTLKLYKRKNMKDYEYLKTQIEPSAMMMTLAVVLGMLASIGVSFYFYKNDPFGNGYGIRRRRRF